MGETVASFPGRSALVALATGALVLPFGAAAAQADGQNHTELPELQTATVVSMRTEARSSATHPAGMTIAYRFDEPLVASVPEPADFFVYNKAGVASHASTAEVANDTVTAFFPGVDTRKKATRLSLAVVEEGAVSDSNAGSNPIGTSLIARTKKYRARRAASG